MYRSSLFVKKNLCNANFKTDITHQVTKKFFDNGCFSLAFDLTADHADDMNCSNLLNQGIIRIEAPFKVTLPNTITCLIYSECDSSIEIQSTKCTYVMKEF